MTPDDYIRIALGKANDDRQLAKRALLQLTAKDADVAQLFAAPHMDGLITQALDHYLGKSGDVPKPVAEPVAAPAPPEADRPKEIPPTEASDKHRDAVLKMVAAFGKSKAKV